MEKVRDKLLMELALNCADHFYNHFHSDTAEEMNGFSFTGVSGKQQ